MIIFASCGQHKIQCITLMKIFVGQPQPDLFYLTTLTIERFWGSRLSYHFNKTYRCRLCWNFMHMCRYNDINVFLSISFCNKTVEPWSSDCDFNIHSSNLSFIDPCVTVWANWIVFIKTSQQYITMLFTGLFIWNNIISLFTVSSFPVAYWIPGHKVQNWILRKSFSE